jgi:hypothetical protein
VRYRKREREEKAIKEKRQKLGKTELSRKVGNNEKDDNGKDGRKNMKKRDK